MSTTNPNQCETLNFPAATFKKAIFKASEINFSILFNISKILFQHVTNIKEVLIKQIFCTKLLQSSIDFALMIHLRLD